MRPLFFGSSDDVKQIDPIDRVPRMLQAPELTDGLPFHDAEEEVVERV